ncbi:MAG TPA: tetratricopeptide repeat protein [Terriglobales bacterium]|nr:tetratricopeptide repeat protein [Terriglobales bacterium]
MRIETTILALALLTAFTQVAGAADNAPALLAAGRIDDAITTLQGELSQAPNDPQAHNLLCRAYFAVEDWDRAINACEKAVALAPNNSNYHLWLGRTYGEKADASSFFTAAGLAKKLRTEFERAVELDPNNVDARTDLAEFYLEAPGIVGGGQDKARAQAAKLATLDAAKAHWINGRLAEKKKDLVTAEQEYRTAIQADNGSAEAWMNLASFYRHTGRMDEMEEAINHAGSAPAKESVVLMDAAETLIRAGRNFPGAIRLLRQYLTSTSTVEEAPTFKAHYLLGTILEKQGDKRAAAQEYSAALTLARNFSRAQDALKRVNR